MVMRGFSVVLVWLAVAHTAACSAEARPELGSATTDPGQEVQQIIRTTASPFCPGKTLDSCPSPKAGEWRRDIHEWADAGVPADEIRVRLQNRVPHMDLSIRPARWSGVIPLIALLLSTLLMWLVARRILRRGAATVQREHSERQDLIDQQLDEELARWADGS
jgi:cytochrome c-type biogenesis protein CcmH/NrfF